MKITKSKLYSLLLIIILLSQIYIPSFKFNVFFQLFILIAFFFTRRKKIPLKFIKEIQPLFYLFLIGFLGALFYLRPLNFILKDVFHFMKPLLGMLLGAFIFHKISNLKKFFQTLVITAITSAIIHFLIILFFTEFQTGSISAIRQFTRGNYLEIFAFFILLYYQKITRTPLFTFNKKKLVFLKTILLFSCVLYFSRTMLVTALILLVTVKGYSKITIKSLKVILILLVSIGLFYTYLFSVKINKNESGLQNFLYKVKIAPEELFQTKINRENHKDLWDHWRGYEAKRALTLLSENSLYYVTGTGYGSLVNLKFKAPLDNGGKGMRYISELHNGYVYVFYKLGVLGLLIYLFFLFKLYRLIYLNKGVVAVFISAIGVFYLFSTMTISGIYNTGDPIIFILGGLLIAKNEI